MTREVVPMISSRPYLLRAMYEWLIDNNLTPHIMVNTMVDGVSVPERFIEDGKIILNIDPNAIHKLDMSNEAVAFQARFSGVAHRIYVPISAITAIYAIENGRGMLFGEENDGADSSASKDGTEQGRPLKKLPGNRTKPNLTIVK